MEAATEQKVENAMKAQYQPTCLETKETVSNFFFVFPDNTPAEMK